MRAKRTDKLNPRFYWFLKYLLVPLAAMLAGYGIAIWQMMGKG
jgi:hypothetical protein